MKVCLSEQGTVWVPYTIRKMDHAFLLGRKAKWSETGRLDRRPSEIFREHFVVAPFPEENVERVVAEVGIEPIVFGSDFPHGEGLGTTRRLRADAAGVVRARAGALDHARQPRAIPRRLRMTSEFAGRVALVTGAGRCRHRPGHARAAWPRVARAWWSPTCTSAAPTKSARASPRSSPTPRCSAFRWTPATGPTSTTRRARSPPNWDPCRSS